MIKGNSQAMAKIVVDVSALTQNAIDALDLRQIRYMLCLGKPRGLGWSDTKADQAIVEYKRFLGLKSKNRAARIVPTKLVDQVWHQHILDTRKYELDCRMIFGGTLHHNPYLGLQGDADVWEASFKETHALYDKEFGGVRSFATKAAGCDAADIRAAGCDAADIEPAGCDAADIRAAGCDAADIEPAGCDAADIRLVGCQPAYFLASAKHGTGSPLGR